MQSTVDRPSNLNLPNALTVVRIVGVPLFGWLLLIDHGNSVHWRVWAWVAFVLLMFTDKLDGDLARKHNLITDFGKIADPIADKALTGMAFIGLGILFNDEPFGWLLWIVVVLMLIREWGITIMRFFMVRKGFVMPASKGGKLKTMLQSFAIGGYVLPLELWDNVFAQTLRWITHGLMAAGFVVAMVTGVQYVFDARALARGVDAER